MYSNRQNIIITGLCLAMVLVLASGCSDQILFRAGSNYFPLTAGRSWKYTIGEDTVYVEVRGDTAILDRGCIQVDRNFAPEYFITSPTEVRKLIVNTRLRPGGEDTVECRFGVCYYLPLVAGNWYTDRFDTTLIYGPDTINYTHLLEVKVSKVDLVQVPAGSFDDCYRLEFREKIMKDDTTENVWVEWLAPNVGVVKRVQGTVEEVLVDYQ